MSNLSAILLVFILLAIAGATPIFYRADKIIKRLRCGQRQWRNIALFHAALTSAHDVTRKGLCRMVERQDKELEAWEDDFRKLRVHIWGNPPLHRKMKDVIDVITVASNELNAVRKTSAGLAEIVKRQDSEIKGLIRDRETDKNATRYSLEKADSYVQMLATCLKNKWVIVDTSGTGTVEFTIKLIQRGKPLAVIARGDSPELAFQQAVVRTSGL